MFTRTDFERGTFGRNPESDKRYFMAYLERMERAGARVWLLEYTRDASMAEEIERFCSARGWGCFVSDSVELD